ncbi:hypothetical protein NDU88_001814 [Pleurodeles waltl]|uniref:Uncharacterized protein n=1 Tax=Pleurodeles waltl TaxID=8319 RepID=A0AAV7MPT1_PLEWA|nr:hypothetical protein NDU88_001814 [Pleurodeles waltl]
MRPRWARRKLERWAWHWETHRIPLVVQWHRRGGASTAPPLCICRVFAQGRDHASRSWATDSLSGSLVVLTPLLHSPSDVLQGLSGDLVKQAGQAHCIGLTLRPRPSFWARSATGDRPHPIRPQRQPPPKRSTAATSQSRPGSRELVKDAISCI